MITVNGKTSHNHNTNGLRGKRGTFHFEDGTVMRFSAMSAYNRKLLVEEHGRITAIEPLNRE